MVVARQTGQSHRHVHHRQYNTLNIRTDAHVQPLQYVASSRVAEQRQHSSMRNVRRSYDSTNADIETRVISGNSYKERHALWIEPSLRSTGPEIGSRIAYGERHSRESSREDLVAALRRYLGLWVATRGTEILASGDSPAVVIQFLRDHNLRADSVLRVPMNAAKDQSG